MIKRLFSEEQSRYGETRNRVSPGASNGWSPLTLPRPEEAGRELLPRRDNCGRERVPNRRQRL